MIPPPDPAAPRLLRVALLCACSLAAGLDAATYRWDFDGNPSVGNPNVATVGPGTWSTSVATWNNASSPATDVAWANGNTAQFGSTSSSDTGSHLITVDASVTSLASNGSAAANGSLLFNSSNFKLTASSGVSIALNGDIYVETGATGTLGGSLALTAVSNTKGGGKLILEDSASVTSTGDMSASSLEVKTGATLTTTSRLLVNGAISPSLLVNGGTVNVGGTGMLIGYSAGDDSVVTLSSGAITATSATASSGALQLGPSSGTTVGAATFNLDGGTLTFAQVKKGGSTGATATFNFNGGVLKVKTSTTLGTTFMTGLNTANVRNGGAIIDTNGQDITIAQALVHSTVGGDNTIDGGLTKRGAGTLTLTGANTFTGDISVEAGTLSINSAFIHDTADVSVASGAVFALAFSGADTVGTLTLGGIAQEIGTYGSLASSAQFKSAFFTGNGILNVTAFAIPEPSSAAALLGALALGAAALRRRR